MAKIMTLSGPGLSAPSEGQCKCVLNTRTKRYSKLCFIGKSKRTRSGWIFQKGECGPRKK